MTWKGVTSLEYGDTGAGGKYPSWLMLTLSSSMTFLSCFRMSSIVSEGCIL